MRGKKPAKGEAVRQAVNEEASVTGTVFDHMNDDAYVMVWRRSETSKRMVYMGRLAPSEATEEVIQKALGGGFYQCREKEPAADGSMVFGRSRTFELGGPRKPNGTLEGVGETPQSPAAAAALQANTPGATDNTQSVLNAATLSVFMDLVKATKDVKSSGPDPLAYLKPIMDMQTRIVELLMNMMTANKQGDSKKDMLDMMASMKDLLSPAQPINSGNPHEVVKNILETIRDVREAADDLGPARGESTDPMAILGKLAEVIVEEQQRKHGGKRAAVRAAPGATTRVAPVLTTTGEEAKAVTEGAEVPMWRRVLRKEGPKLIAQAQAGRDPEAIAVLALEFAPSNIRGVLTEFFTQETEAVVKAMLEELPALAEFPQWLTDFVLSAQERLGLMDEGEEPSGTVEGGEGHDPSQGS
jgi:hypothetical protein